MQFATCHPDRVYVAKGLCRVCYNKQWFQKNHTVHSQRNRRYAKEHPDKFAGYTRKFKYKMTPAIYKDIWDSQNGLCEICKQPETGRGGLRVDHDHSTGDLRALLCMRCNAGIGLFRESLELLKLAVRYLELHNFTSKS